MKNNNNNKYMKKNSKLHDKHQNKNNDIINQTNNNHQYKPSIHADKTKHVSKHKKDKTARYLSIKNSKKNVSNLEDDTHYFDHGGNKTRRKIKMPLINQNKNNNNNIISAIKLNQYLGGDTISAIELKQYLGGGNMETLIENIIENKIELISLCKLTNNKFELVVNTNIHQVYIYQISETETIAQLWNDKFSHWPLYQTKCTYILDLNGTDIKKGYITDINTSISTYKYNDLLIFEVSHEKNANKIFFAAYDGKISKVYHNIKFLFICSDYIYVTVDGTIYQISTNDMIKCIKNNNQFNVFCHKNSKLYFQFNITTPRYGCPPIMYFNTYCDNNLGRILICDYNLSLLTGYFDGKIYCILKCNFTINQRAYIDNYKVDNCIISNEHTIMSRDDIATIFKFKDINDINDIQLSPLFKYSIDRLKTHHIKYLSLSVIGALISMLQIRRYYKYRNTNSIYVLPLGIILMITHYLI